MFRILHLLFDSFSCKNLYKDKSLYVEKSLIIKKKKKYKQKKRKRKKKPGKPKRGSTLVGLCFRTTFKRILQETCLTNMNRWSVFYSGWGRRE